MQVVILAGGQGTRAYPYTQTIPKALMPIGGVPIVEQVMRIYAAHGYREFLLSCGYLKEAIYEYFRDHCRQWDVQCIDTGDTSDTGDRIAKLQDLLGPTFHATYCDGLGDVDLDALLEFHRSHPGVATVTAAPLRSQYGLMFPDEAGRVTGFEEKPVLPGFWLNGGFFIFDRAVFSLWEGHNLERDVLPALARRRQLYMYTHRGFWHSMDTYKDQQELDRLWAPYGERLEQWANGTQEGGAAVRVFRA
jgi:glucose-1-phosphate cytidylyltransferase